MAISKPRVLATAADWYTTMPDPVLATRPDGIGHLQIRRYIDTPAEMKQPALTDNLICLHLGGGKEVRRWHRGRLDVHDVPLGALTVMPAHQTNRWLTRGPIDFAHLTLSPAVLARVVAEDSDRDPATLLWFGTNWKGDATMQIDAFAMEAASDDILPGCFVSEKPMTVTLGAPGLGATQADLEAAYGPKPNMEADGTVAYMYGSEPVGDGINVKTKELKYRVVDGKVIAVKFGVVNELE